MRMSGLFKKSLFVVAAPLLFITLAVAVFSSWNLNKYLLVFLVAATSLVCFVISYVFFKRHINSPLNKLTVYADQLVSHDYSAAVNFHSNDEFDVLAASMQYLAIDIQGILGRAEQAVFELEVNRQKLNDTLGYMTAIIDNMADGLMVTDPQGKIIRVNRTLTELLGQKEQELLGRKAGDVFGPHMNGLMKESDAAGARDVASSEIALPGGRIGKALATSIYTETETAVGTAPQGNGAPAGVVTLVSDVTREKEIDRMKTDFISTVSHELRTPLTSILGFARIIEKRFAETIIPRISGVDKKTERAAGQILENTRIIQAEGERLTALIHDMLDIAKMEAGKVEWKTQDVSVAELIERSAAATASLFGQKGLALEKDIEPDLPLLKADKDRLMQVCINLISNAIKFTDTGSITIKAERAKSPLVKGGDGETGGSSDEIHVSVIDTGIGIALDDMPKVFEKFRQVGDTLTGKPKGTGLGLPICKQIVEHHGGRIWVESEPGKGSSFFFSLPVSSPARQGAVPLDSLIKRLRENIPAASPSMGTDNKTVLVVDDDRSIRALLRQELEAEGYRVREALDGADGVRQAKDEPPDLIILDVMMPGLNGFDAAAVLKNDPSTMRTPILILSVVEDRDRGYRIGVDRYLTKPVDADALLKEVGALISQGASKKKIMVVDENESTVRTLTELLEAKGYQVVAACNGSECISRALLERPDMIIIDAVLSDRLNIVQTLRAENGLENVYFVFAAGK